KLKSGQKGRKLAEENELMKSGKFGVAATIMSKMGYREGFGLGAKEQGISRALQVQRTGRNVGLIVGEEKASAITNPSFRNPTAIPDNSDNSNKMDI
uniref:G-patch domain-containing protein n=1 Tax=Meloidogyne javanica TaxID=6303 RepID=A0A915LQJ1_MELJA